MTSVDDIWAQLKASSLNKLKEGQQRGKSGATAPEQPENTGAQDAGRVDASGAAPLGIAHLEQPSSRQGPGRRGPGSTSGASAPRTAAGSAAAPVKVSERAAAAPPGDAAPDRTEPVGMSCAEIEAALQKEFHAIRERDPQRRRLALQRIADALLKDPKPPVSALEEALETVVGKHLLRCFDDAAEATRSLAVETTAALLREAPESCMAFLPYLMPVIEERVIPMEPEDGTALAEGRKAVTAVLEQSEHVRHALFLLAVWVVDEQGEAVSAYASELVEMAKVGVADAYHEVNLAACDLAQGLARCLKHQLWGVSKPLAAAVMPLTTHRRSAVRVAALRALGPLMMCGAQELILDMVGWRDPNVVAIKAFYEGEVKVNFCGKLITDASVPVRLAFLDTIGLWLTDLPERQDHEQRLTQFFLAALNDATPAVAESAAAWIERLGEQYEKDHEKELKENREYLPDAAQGYGWLPSDVHTRLQRRPLPYPLTRRPALGARMVVQKHFGAMVHALCHELNSWQEDPRARGAELLRTFMLYTEDFATRYLDKLLPAIVAAVAHCREPGRRPGASPDHVDATGRRMLTHLEEACGLLGSAVEPAQYLRLLWTAAGPAEPVASARAAAMEVLAWVLDGARGRGDVVAHAGAAAACVCDGAALRAQDVQVKRAGLLLVASLGAAMGGADAASWGVLPDGTDVDGEYWATAVDPVSKRAARHNVDRGLGKIEEGDCEEDEGESGAGGGDVDTAAPLERRGLDLLGKLVVAAVHLGARPPALARDAVEGLPDVGGVLESLASGAGESSAWRVLLPRAAALFGAVPLRPGGSLGPDLAQDAEAFCILARIAEPVAATTSAEEQHPPLSADMDAAAGAAAASAGAIAAEMHARLCRGAGPLEPAYEQGLAALLSTAGLAVESWPCTYAAALLDRLLPLMPRAAATWRCAGPLVDAVGACLSVAGREGGGCVTEGAAAVVSVADAALGPEGAACLAAAADARAACARALAKVLSGAGGVVEELRGRKEVVDVVRRLAECPGKTGEDAAAVAAMLGP
ncbi:unnamed protein product [Pedinophyceae sp. YPF-701]|nr:unnamed protein product [Pedinophyceae sp. YPF-701]